MAEGAVAGNATEIGPIKATLTARDQNYTVTFNQGADSVTRLEEASAALKAETRQLETAMAALPAEAERVAAGARHAAHDANGLKAALHDLKSQTGRRSALGELSELAMGAGPLIGLALAAEAVSKLSEKAIELREEFDKGEKSAGQMIEEIIKSVPIYGKIWEAGRNMREVFTGDEGIAKGIEESAKFADECGEAIGKMRDKTREWRAEVRKGSEDLERMIAMAGKSPTQRKLFEKSNAYLDKTRSIEEEYGKHHSAGEEKELQAKLDEALKREHEAKAKAANTKDRFDNQSGWNPFTPDTADVKRAKDDADAATAAVVRLKAAMTAASDAANGKGGQLADALKEMVFESRRIAFEGLAESAKAAMEKTRPAFEAWRREVETTKSAIDELRERERTWGLSEADLAARKMGGLKDEAREVRALAGELEKLNDISETDKGDSLRTHAARLEGLTAAYNQHIITLDQVRGATAKLDKDFGHSLESEANAWREKFQTPLEKLKSEFEHLKAIHDAGDFKDEKEYDRAIKKAEQEFAGAGGGDGPRTARAADGRSSEAADLIANALNGTGAKDVAAKQLEAQMGMRDSLAKIANNTAKTVDTSSEPIIAYGGF